MITSAVVFELVSTFFKSKVATSGSLENIGDLSTTCKIREPPDCRVFANRLAAPAVYP